MPLASKRARANQQNAAKRSKKEKASAEEDQSQQQLTAQTEVASPKLVLNVLTPIDEVASWY